VTQIIGAVAYANLYGEGFVCNRFEVLYILAR